MDRLRLERGYFRKPSGEAVYLLGANYWPQRHGPWMYRDDWNVEEVRAELEQLVSLGCNVARIFCFLPDFLPLPDTVDAEALRRLSSLVQVAAEKGLWSIPTFLVGHMSGENWQPDWSLGRNWYNDKIVLQACELLIRTVARQFSGDGRIAAWLMTNEWPLFAGATSSAEALAWAKRLCSVVREVDPQTAVSLGDGAWDVIGGQPNVLPAEAFDPVDFLGPHFYPRETDAIRHSLFAPFAMRMAQTVGKPVLLEEFGCSSDQASDEFGADYYRTVLWSAFGAANCGSLFWNSHDFPLAERAPYCHHPYELHFGAIRVDGSLKPQSWEVARFAKFLAAQDPDDWKACAPRAAVGRSAFYRQLFPFDWGWSKPQLRDLYLQAYACAIMGGMDAMVLDIDRPIPEHVRVVFLPCLQQVTTADVTNLQDFVRAGGAVYLSYGGEPWFPHLDEFIGARPVIRYGLVSLPSHKARAPEQVALRFVTDFGSLSKGNVIQVQAPLRDRRSAPLTCMPVEASVIAVDEAGNPAVMMRQLGSGYVVFVTYPLEYLGLHGHDSNARDGTWKIYHAVARKFDALTPLRAAHPWAQSFLWRSAHRSELRRLMVVNHGWEEITTEICGDVGAVRDLESGAAVNPRTLSLAKKGVRALELTAASGG